MARPGSSAIFLDGYFICWDIIPPHKKILDLARLDAIQVAKPESAEQAIENLLMLDARCLDRDTRQKLLLLLPELVHIRRAWKAEYLEYGCVSCHKKRPWYGAGGFCAACWGRIYQRMRKRYRKAIEVRNISAELEAFRNALQLRYNVAQRLLGGDE